MMTKPIRNPFRIAKTAALALTATTAALSLSACGKQAFLVTEASQVQAAPGSFTIPPKVDILLAEDDTGSRLEAYDSINSQWYSFINGLQASGWDYHFTSIPLTTDRPISQITASVYDGNWGSQWQSPYPGAHQYNSQTIEQDLFVMPQNYTFLSASQVGSSQNGQEPGFYNINQAFQNRVGGTGFLRDDAMLVIFVVGNGDDTSGVNYCTRSDGISQPCSDGSYDSSFNGYKASFQNLKSNPSMVQFHAAVSTSNTRGRSCLNGNANPGSRYISMAQQLHGAAYDICSQSVTSILNQLSANLQPIQQAMQRRYLPIDSQPNPSTIVVTRYVGGSSSQSVTIPQSATNGWTYAGYLNNAYLIDSPVPMNLYTGYAIELHGSAKLTGSDTARVDYTHAGAQNSAQ